MLGPRAPQCPSSRAQRRSRAAAPSCARRRHDAAAVVVAAAVNAANANAPSSSNSKRHVAVVGAGVGGLCVAGILAREGQCRVTIFEQNEDVGGRCQGEWLEVPPSSVEMGSGGGSGSGPRRFRFDTGPSLLLLPDAYRAAFARMGQPSLEAAGLRLRRVGPDAAYRIFFTDGDDGGSGEGDDKSRQEGGAPQAPPPPPPPPTTRSLDLLYDADAMVAQLDARGRQRQGSAPDPATATASAGRPPPPPPPPPLPPPAAAESYRTWLEDAVRMLDSGFGAFIARDFGPRSDGPLKSLLRVLDPRVLLPLLVGRRLPSNVLEMLEPHARALERRFPGDPDLQALLSFQDLYVGLSPQSAPGVFSLLAATEIRDGVFYAEGGFGAVRDALLRAALAAGDVEVRTGARVRAVVAADDGDGNGGAGGGVVQGVEVEEEEGARFVAADAVVCNADVPSAYALLRGRGRGGGGEEEEGKGGAAAGPASSGKSSSSSVSRYGAEVSARLLSERYAYSAGVIAYYWCVEGGALTQLPQHTVFVRSGGGGPRGAARAWRRARSARELERAPNFYVHCPARTDPTAVSHPGEADSVMVLLPVANLQEVAAGAAEEGAAGAGGASANGGGIAGGAVFDESLVAAGRAAILRGLAAACPGTLAGTGGAADLADRIVREEVRTPPQWRERHSLAHGAAFGLSHSLDQLAALRPALKDGHVRGFYCVGASARPGNGVPLVLTGAGLCADAVLADLAALG